MAHVSHAASHRDRHPSGAVASLGDFTADRRMLLLVAMAVVVGAGGAAGAWVLLKLIALVSNLVWRGRLDAAPISFHEVSPSLWMVLAPALGGLAVGLMARFGSEKIRGHGIPEAIEAILIGGSRMSAKVALLKPLSSAIAIGTGGPFGAEGPIIMTGGAFGSLFAQVFNLSAAERKTLLVAGASAGMTGVFGTPVAAVLLAVELLLFEWKPRSFLPVTVAVLVAAGLRPFLLGAGPLFHVAVTPALGWSGLALCVVAGVAAGLQSSLLTKLLYTAEDAFSRLKLHWMWWPALGGIAVGLGGLGDPRALGVGYDVIGDLLSGRIALDETGRLLAVKASIWILALASGTSGGVLAPLLILGGALGAIEGHWLPGGPGYWALIGMAGMMGGTMRAPLTGALFAAELTGDFAALPGLLAASAAAYCVTVLLMKRSILTEKIARRGLHLTREYSIDPFQMMQVRDVMVGEVETLPAAMPVDQAVAFFAASEPRHKSYPVIDAQGRAIGMAPRAEVIRWITEGAHEDQTLADVISDAGLLTGSPEESVGALVERMVERDVGRVSIVDATGRLVGLVTRKDLLRVHSRQRALEVERQATPPWVRK
ncbi:MAG TPA: chloride channel protein [Caulobacteraceae bacterium]|jgi:H+/Cl- antiporter ClcA|nr:chloride channel protein [Caulobacteraceae bacterium]